MKIFELKKGEYRLNDSLSVKLISDIEFQFGNTYVLSGENGIGKTSFLKNIIIPKISQISNNNFLFFYTEQDILLQYYIIKSYYKGLKKSNKKYSNIEDSLQNLKKEFLNFNHYKNKQIVFILDEIDQYLELCDFIDDLKLDNSTFILSTHNKNQLKIKDKVINITFMKINNELSKIDIN